MSKIFESLKTKYFVYKPLYIFDLDGTLSFTEHRQHILQDTSDPDRWDKFFSLCDQDIPNVNTLEILWHLSRSADILIWSGRSSVVREKTVDWLYKYTRFTKRYIDKRLRMREEGDFTPDEALKQQWLRSLSRNDRLRLVAVFDDRDKVVKMWRDAGVLCCQVAPGIF